MEPFPKVRKHILANFSKNVETQKIVFNTRYYQCGKLGLLGFCLCKLQRYFYVFRMVCLKKCQYIKPCNTDHINSQWQFLRTAVFLSWRKVILAVLMYETLWRLVFIKHLCKFCPRLTHLFWDKYIQNF